MTTELYWLVLTILITALFWLPYVLDRIVLRGLMATVGDTQPEGQGAQSIWARRAIRAHQNAIENLALFAPLVLALHALNLSTPMTRNAAAIYFFARLGHFLVYSLGVPVARTLLFAVSWLMIVILGLTLLGGI